MPGFIDRIKAWLAPFTTTKADQNVTNNACEDENLMPDISTQTPENWVSTTASTSRQSDAQATTRRGARMAGYANMPEEEWGDCWELIKDMADGAGARRALGGGRRVGALVGGQFDGTAEHGRTPPTPGSGHGAYINPLSTPPAAATTDLEMEDADASEGMTSADRQLQNMLQEAVNDIAEPVVAHTPSHCPTPGGPSYVDDTIEELTDIDMIDASYDPIHVADSKFSVPDAPHKVKEANESVHDTPEKQFEPLLPGITTASQARDSESEIQSSSQMQTQPHPQNVTQGSDPTSPTAAPTFFQQQGSPGFPFDIQSAAHVNIGVEPSAASQLPGTRASRQDIESNSIQIQDGDFIEAAVPPAEVQSRSEAVAFDAVALAEVISASQLASHEPSLPTKDSTIRDLEEQGEAIAGSEDKVRAPPPTPTTAEPAPATNMPVKLPNSYHEEFLQRAIEAGASPHEQIGLMQTLREVERNAKIEDVKVEGAMEVDPSELVAPSPAQPVALASEAESSPPAMEKATGRKRTGDNGDDTAGGKKAKKSVKDIVALTDEQHLANGWEYLQLSHFANWKAPELKDYLRTVLSEKRWWSGLTKPATLKKIMEWQEKMKVLKEQMQAEGGESGSGEEDEDEDGSDADADVMDVDEPEEEKPVMKRAISKAASTSSALSTAKTMTSIPRSAKSKSKTPMPQTPADRVGQVGEFNRGSSTDNFSDRSVFHDPGSERRSTPLLEKFEAVKAEEEAFKESPKKSTKKSSSSAAFTSAPSTAPLSPRRSRGKTAEIAKQDTAAPKTQANPKVRKESSTETYATAQESIAEMRRSRSKTADSAKHGIGGEGAVDDEEQDQKIPAKKAGRGRKSLEPKPKKKAEPKGRKSVEPTKAAAGLARSTRSRTTSVAP